MDKFLRGYYQKESSKNLLRGLIKMGKGVGFLSLGVGFIYCFVIFGTNLVFEFCERGSLPSFLGFYEGLGFD